MPRELTKQQLEDCLSAIASIIQEWLGNHIPEEGTEDHDKWQIMVLDRNDIKSAEDVEYWIEIYTHRDVEDFFAEIEV